MSSGDAAFEAATVVRTLLVTASEFGYRAQALFAESLAQIGFGIDSVNSVGHPDILGWIEGRVLRIQVKSTGQRSFTLSAEDLEGVRPRTGQERGYIALLDLGPPLAWVCVPYDRARILVGRTVPIAMLKAMDDATFSAQCTKPFVETILARRESIEAYTFALIRKGAESVSGSAYTE